MRTPDINHSHRGFTIAELIIAMLLLTTVSAVLVPVVQLAARQRQAVRQRQLALNLAENTLEAALLRNWDDLTTERLSTMHIADLTVLAVPLPGLTRNILVTDRPSDEARQITVEIRWRNHAGDWTAPVRLSAWAFPPTGDAA